METTIIFKISGMHCVSCGMNIDGELEDMAGVSWASTNYARQETVVTFDADQITIDVIQTTIRKLGYECHCDDV